MNQINWIEELPKDPGSIDIHRLVDRELAIKIAGQDELNIENPDGKVQRFTRSLPKLLVWFRENYRNFPWRRSRDPWEILVAEILLQRTHATTVARLFPDFIDRYPSPHEIDEASRTELFEDVESLGFGNKRTDTLHELSRVLIEENGGDVPEDAGELQNLPRVGPYTARACLCFAYGEPLALIDSNVEIIMERVFDYSSTERAHKDETLYALLDALIPHEPDFARAFNLALLDLRDAICSDPPQCPECPLQLGCYTGIRHSS